MAGRIGARFGLMLALVLVALGAWVAGQGLAATAAQSHFAGGSGVRSNWHSHGGFQVLMAEEGRGLTQVRGGPVQEMLPGMPHHVGPGVVHWHGAAPDEHMVQLALMGGEGPTKWLEPVSDKDYLGQ